MMLNTNNNQYIAVWIIFLLSLLLVAVSVVESDERSLQSSPLLCLCIYANDIDDFGYVFSFEKSRIQVERVLTNPPYNYQLKTNFLVVPNITKVVSDLMPFIDSGYKLFLFNGGQFGAAISQLAPAHPELFFMGTSGISPHPNVAMVLTKNYEWFYLNGIMCAAVTRTNTIAALTVIASHSDPFVNTNAFWAGARLVNPSVKVLLATSNSYNDDVVGVYAIDNLVKRGADCFAISQNTQTANARASYHNVVSGGTSSDSRFSAGELVYTSGVRHWDDTLFNVISQVLNDSWIPSQSISDGFHRNAIQLAWWSTLATSYSNNAMRSTIDYYMNMLASSPTEKIFCGELATLSGVPKSNQSDCMSTNEILSTRRMVPGVIWTANYTRESVTVKKYVNFRHPASIVITCIVGIFVMVLLANISHVKYYWMRDAYLASSPLFMIIILSGMILIAVSCIFWSLPPSIAICALRPWLAGIGWTLIVGAILAKTHRIYQIFSIRNFKVEAISDMNQIVKIMSGLVAAQIVILLCWQLLDPLKPRSRTISGLAYNEVYYYCSSKSVTPFVVFMTFNAAALVPSIVVAWVTRSVADKYNESSSVGLTSIITFLLGLLIIGTTIVVKESIMAQYILPTMGMLSITLAIFFLMFIPKMLYVHNLWEVATTANTAKVSRNAKPDTSSGSLARSTSLLQVPIAKKRVSRHSKLSTNNV